MKRLYSAVLCLALMATALVCFFSRGLRSGFGDVQRTRMAEPHAPSSLEQAVAKARKALHLSVMDTRQRNYIAIGDAQMEWSLMSTSMKTGWLYFHKPGANDPLWEFAPCARSSLSELRPADLDAEFVRMQETNRIHAAFNAGSWYGQPMDGRAIPVKERQIILARRVDKPRTLYAVRLFDQRGAAAWGAIRVEYVEIDLDAAR